MLEKIYEWELQARTGSVGPKHRDFLLSLLAELQKSFLNIYADHPLRRIVAFDSRRDDEYMPAYEEALEKRRLLNLTVQLLKDVYTLTPWVKQSDTSILREQFLQETREKAKKGDSRALYKLGLHYASGTEDIPPDFKRARQCFQQAAASGYAPAISRLGDLYYTGDGVNQNDEHALQWYEKAAGQGFHMAMMQAGRMYYLGRGTQQDFTRARDYFYHVAMTRENFFMVQRYNSLARQYMGQLYERGEGVPQNLQEARHWYRLAADDTRNKGIDARLERLAPFPLRL